MAHSYTEVISSINQALEGLEMQKRASSVPSDKEHLQDEDVLEGDRTKIVGEGKSVANPEGDDEVTLDAATPTRSDPGKKSTDYVLESEPKKEIPSDDTYTKSSKMEDAILKQIYKIFYKSAQDEEEEAPKEDEVAEDIVEEVMEEEPAKETTQEKEARLISEKKGKEFFNKLYNSGVLQKMAFESIQPYLEKISSLQAGRIMAHLEQQGLICSTDELVKSAAYLAGHMIKNLEREGFLAFKKGAKKTTSTRTKRDVIKEAALNETEAVITDLLRKQMGSKLNTQLGSILNPR